VTLFALSVATLFAVDVSSARLGVGARTVGGFNAMSGRSLRIDATSIFAVVARRKRGARRRS